jgi:hypothetical protein
VDRMFPRSTTIEGTKHRFKINDPMGFEKNHFSMHTEKVEIIKSSLLSIFSRESSCAALRQVEFRNSISSLSFKAHKGLKSD